MKRSIRIACALFLILSLCATLVTASAAADPEALQISKISVTQEDGGAVLHMTLQNTGNAGIDEFAVALAFYDENGMRIFGYDSTLEGYTAEICNWYYTPEDAIAAGDSYLTEDIFSDYTGVTEIGVAVRYYHIAGGNYMLIPESEWQWEFPGYEGKISTADRNYYTSPPDSLYDAIGDYYLGYSYYLLDDYNASYYGKNQGGEWITSIEPGSPAAEAGLLTGDLILFADGVKPTEDLYAVEYAIAAIVNGEKVEWVYERDGTVYTMHMPMP